MKSIILNKPSVIV